MSDLIIDSRLINEPIINILKKLKSELNNGKLSVIEQKNDYVRVTCPKHKGGFEVHPSCSVYSGDGDLQYGWWHCLTCNESGDLISFIAACFDCNRAQAKTWLLNKFGNTYVSYKNLNLDSINLNSIKDEKEQEIISEDVLEGFSDYHPYMTKRGLTDEVIKKFDIKYDPLSKSIVFPVRNLDGNIIGFTRRSVEGKKFYIDKGFDKRNIWLLYNIIKDNIREVVVAEGQFSALSSWVYGYPAICLFGAGTTEEQIKVLNNTGIKHYILCYDGDSAGRKGAEKFKRLIRKDVFVDDVIMPEGKDINDLTKDEFINLISLHNN